MTTLPKGPEPFVLSKATPGPVYTKDDPKKIDKDATFVAAQPPRQAEH